MIEMKEAILINSCMAFNHYGWSVLSHSIGSVCCSCHGVTATPPVWWWYLINWCGCVTCLLWLM